MNLKSDSVENYSINSICIVNAHQIIPEFGGVERVCKILQDGFLQNDISVCSYFIEKSTFLRENEYEILNPQKIYCEENIQQLCDICLKRNVQVLLCQTYVGEQLQLCIEVRKRLPIKLVYTFHRNPIANLKEYDDFKDKTLIKYSGRTSKFLANCKLSIGYLYFLIRNTMSNQVYDCYDYDELDAFVTLSPSYKSYFVKHVANLYKRKFYSIYNPVRIEQNKSFYKKKKQILFVGRLTYQKRLDRLFLMWRSIQKQLPDWSLFILGEGDYAKEYKSLSQKLNLKNVAFVGNVSPFEYYKESSIICMTSSYEGLPMVLIEAQSYGCVPVAYNSFGSLKDIIQNQYNGLIIPAFNENKYIKGVVSLAKNEKTLNIMSENSIASVEKFSDKEIIKQWIEMFKQL